MWLLTIILSFSPSPVVLLVAVSGISCAQPTMRPTLKSSKTPDSRAFLTFMNLETGSN